MRAMFRIGVKQGEELGFKLVSQELGVDVKKLLAQRPVLMTATTNRHHAHS